MAKTQADAEKQTSAMDEGKHHIGDFLPPEELSKFLNKYKVIFGSVLETLVIELLICLWICFEHFSIILPSLGFTK